MPLLLRIHTCTSNTFEFLLGVRALRKGWSTRRRSDVLHENDNYRGNLWNIVTSIIFEIRIKRRDADLVCTYFLSARSTPLPNLHLIHLRVLFFLSFPIPKSCQRRRQRRCTRAECADETLEMNHAMLAGFFFHLSSKDSKQDIARDRYQHPAKHSTQSRESSSGVERRRGASKRPE